MTDKLLRDVRLASSQHRYPLLLGSVFLVLWIVLAFDPVDRFDWLLENLLVFVAVPALVLNHGRCALSPLSYTCLFVFLCLHSVGAHYTYSQVPLGDWLKEPLGLSRNHYDRVVHFAFGLLISVPVLEVQSRVIAARGWWSYALPVAVTVSFSGLFEVVEWIIAVIVSADAGNAYLGTQGDEFDAQKDMALATIGAVLAMTYAAIADRAGRPIHRDRCAATPGYS